MRSMAAEASLSTSVSPNTLIFSCNSLIGADSRFGRYYGACRGRKMRHNMALKAVARKRLRVIYAIIRDPKPYAEAA